MDKAEIESAVIANLDAAEASAEVILRPDPYGGWRLRVVSAAFVGLSWRERRGLALGELSDDEFQLLDFLTPDEADSPDLAPVDLDVEALPLWPEAFARAEEQPAVRFASDLDADLPAPVISTFYSLRGGVGRSTALAYTARLLAARGRTIVCVKSGFGLTPSGRPAIDPTCPVEGLRDPRLAPVAETLAPCPQAV